jgi:hypothetical protein
MMPYDDRDINNQLEVYEGSDDELNDFGNYECHFCGQEFKNEIDLYEHDCCY